MPDIRYVCLSDMHLGAENSLLTSLTSDSATTDNDVHVVSPVLVQLVECLRDLILKNETTRKPTLILNGDILELALTSDNLAAMTFERFVEQIFPANGEPLFGEIIYLPGNHDHHLWETARETQYVQFITHNDKQKMPGSFLKVPWHTTEMFDPDPVPSVFIEGIIHRFPGLENQRIKTVYPNLALITEDERRCVIFSHGHFIESMYMLMSTLRRLMFPNSSVAETTYTIEAENFAWIDFFWSTMGRSGEVGTDVELVYDKLQSEPATARLLDNLVDGICDRIKPPGPDILYKEALKPLLRLLLHHIKNRERMTPETELSAAAEQGLRDYLTGPVLRQIIQERSDNIPPHLTFVFGHTHKPFQRDMRFDSGLPPWVRIYNSGGWVVDTVECASTHGGAVILIDENLESTSLRMYNEQDAPEKYKVSVQESTHPNAEQNPFHQRISGLVDAEQNPWKQFSQIVADAIPKRYDNLRDHIDRQ